MKNEQNLLDLYVSKNTNREEYTKPIQKENHVIATCESTLIRIHRSLISGEYTFSEKPKTDHLFSGFDNAEIIEFSKDELNKLIEELPLIDEYFVHGKDILCEECNGDGEVTWEYKYHEKEFECPECYGSGYEQRQKYVETGKQIPDYEKGVLLGNKLIKGRYVKRLINTMDLVGINTISMKYNKNDVYKQALFVVSENIDVIIMPMIV